MLKQPGQPAKFDLAKSVAEAMIEALAGVNRVEIVAAMRGTEAAGFVLRINGEVIPFEGPARPNAREILGAWFGLDIREYDPSNP